MVKYCHAGHAVGVRVRVKIIISELGGIRVNVTVSVRLGDWATRVTVEARVSVGVKSGECTRRVGTVVTVDTLVVAGVLGAVRGQGYGSRSGSELGLG